MIHEVYLPYTREELLPHFHNERHVDEFVTSAARQQAFLSHYGDSTHGMPISREVKLNRQIEKDERIWTLSALKAVFDSQSMPGVLAAAFGMRPPSRWESWEESLGAKEDQQLYFEVSIPSPKSYRQSLKDSYLNQGKDAHILPYVVDAAAGRTSFEGPTRVDAVLSNRQTDFSVMFEAKVLSDISSQVTFDPFRNQLARNIDVLVDEDSGEHLSSAVANRFFCLLTPRAFKDKPSSRYYGLLMKEYTENSDLLCEHLPHRERGVIEEAASRIGWLTFEDCKDVCPDSCKWLP